MCATSDRTLSTTMMYDKEGPRKGTYPPPNVSEAVEIFVLVMLLLQARLTLLRSLLTLYATNYPFTLSLLLTSQFHINHISH